MECQADGVLCDVVTADLKAGESRALLLDAPRAIPPWHARIVEKDALALDNERWYAAQGEGSYRVALAGENVFLEKALSLLRGYRAAAHHGPGSGRNREHRSVCV